MNRRDDVPHDRSTTTTEVLQQHLDNRKRKKPTMKRILVFGAALLLGTAVFVLPGGTAQAADITVPIDTFVDEPTGSLTTLATVPTGAFAGRTCDVVAVGINQESVHANNDLIAASGTSVTMYDVEREPGAVTPAGGTILLDDTIVISVKIGNRDSGWESSEGQYYGYFSGGMNIEFDCLPPVTPPAPTIPPASTVPPPSSTVAPPSSTVAPPSSTVPPPESTTPPPPESTTPPPQSSIAPSPSIPAGTAPPAIPAGGLPVTR
jgi:hypothetical protein